MPAALCQGRVGACVIRKQRLVRHEMPGVSCDDVEVEVFL